MEKQDGDEMVLHVEAVVVEVVAAEVVVVVVEVDVVSEEGHGIKL